MRFRTPDCRGGHYGTDKSPGAHSPHNYFPNPWGQALVCNGWTEGEALASTVIEAVRQASGKGRLIAHPGVLMEMNRLLVPDSPAEVNEVQHELGMLYGVPMSGDPSLRPGRWIIGEPLPPDLSQVHGVNERELAAAAGADVVEPEEAPQADPPVGGQVPRLEGDNIIMNWRHKRP